MRERAHLDSGRSLDDFAAWRADTGTDGRAGGRTTGLTE